MKEPIRELRYHYLVTCVYNKCMFVCMYVCVCVCVCVCMFVSRVCNFLDFRVLNGSGNQSRARSRSVLTIFYLKFPKLGLTVPSSERLCCKSDYSGLR